MNIEHDERVAIERPKHTLRVELQTADEVRGLVDPQLAFGREVGVELQDTSAPGVIVLSVVELRSTNEKIAFGESLQCGTHGGQTSNE
jgi:hypothetical protein